MKNLLFSFSNATNHLLKELSLDDALNFCIRDIGAGQNIDRCYIFKNKRDDGFLKLYYAYEWCNVKVESYLGSPDLNGIPYDFLPGLYDILSKDKPMYGLVKDIENELFKETMEMQGIKSYLFTPIFSDNLFWGWIGYDDCKNDRKWIVEEVHALHTIAKNIGIRLNQERTLLKLENTLAKFDFYMSSSKQAMWEFDVETRSAVISYNWGGIQGYANEDIPNAFEFWKKSLHPEDAARVLFDLECYITGVSSTYEGVARLLHKDGHYVWIKYLGLMERGKDGTPKKIIGTHTDVSELKEKEKQLELSEAKFRFIADNTTDLICQHSNEGNFVYVSKSSAEIVGFTAIELIDKSPLDFMHKGDLMSIENFYHSIIKNRQNGVVTFRFRNKNGNFIWLETSTKVIVDIENQVIGFQTSSRDISRRILTEREIKTALLKEKKFNDLKSKFVSMASHQFRTPLTVIYSNAEILELKTSSLEKKASDELKTITLRIKNEVDRMTQLMDNILIFGKHEAKKIEKKIQPINFNKFIDTLIKTYFDLNCSDRKIKVLISGKKKVFFSDETLLVHILTNLINNAFKYSAGQANPLLLITYHENEIEVQVVDYGIGIPQKEISQVFTSFFRASNTSTIIGSGLGLAIVKQFTEFLNGTIVVQTKENHGTTIKLSFPYE